MIWFLSWLKEYQVKSRSPRPSEMVIRPGMLVRFKSGLERSVTTLTPEPKLSNVGLKRLRVKKVKKWKWVPFPDDDGWDQVFRKQGNTTLVAMIFQLVDNSFPWLGFVLCSTDKCRSNIPKEALYCNELMNSSRRRTDCERRDLCTYLVYDQRTSVWLERNSAAVSWVADLLIHDRYQRHVANEQRAIWPARFMQFR